jgi:hypothetical protein
MTSAPHGRGETIHRRRGRSDHRRLAYRAQVLCNYPGGLAKATTPMSQSLANAVVAPLLSQPRETGRALTTIRDLIPRAAAPGVRPGGEGHPPKPLVLALCALLAALLAVLTPAVEAYRVLLSTHPGAPSPLQREKPCRNAGFAGPLTAIRCHPPRRRRRQAAQPERAKRAHDARAQEKGRRTSFISKAVVLYCRSRSGANGNCGRACRATAPRGQWPTDLAVRAAQARPIAGIPRRSIRVRAAVPDI